MTAAGRQGWLATHWPRMVRLFWASTAPGLTRRRALAKHRSTTPPVSWLSRNPASRAILANFEESISSSGAWETGQRGGRGVEGSVGGQGGGGRRAAARGSAPTPHVVRCPPRAPCRRDWARAEAWSRCQRWQTRGKHCAPSGQSRPLAAPSACVKGGWEGAGGRSSQGQRHTMNAQQLCGRVPPDLARPSPPAPRAPRRPCSRAAAAPRAAAAAAPHMS